MVLVLCKPRLVGRKPDPTCIRSPPEPRVQTVICRAILYRYTLSGLNNALPYYGGFDKCELSSSCSNDCPSSSASSGPASGGEGSGAAIASCTDS